MNYAIALAKLLNTNTNPKLGLDRMRLLLRLLNLSGLNSKIIQVVGTNGKGSTVAFIEAILRAHNYTTGLFTSPHLSCARERIRINSVMISEDLFVEAFLQVNNICDNLSDQPSFFERIFAMAMWLFNKYKLDVIILEAGLGGRLDATTASEPHILGISTIALDHQHILGETIEKITQEKIAAARNKQQVISVEQEEKSTQEILKAKKSLGFDLSWSHKSEYLLGLYGDHQKINAGLALALVNKIGLTITNTQSQAGLLSVNWPGRFEIIRKEVDILLDGAHNISGIKALGQALITHPEFNKRPCVLLFGSLVGQSPQKITALLKYINFNHIFIHRPSNLRAESIESLRNIFINQKIDERSISAFKSFEDVISCAKNLGAYILICGSLYTIGEARAALLDIPCDPKMPNF